MDIHKERAWCVRNVRYGRLAVQLGVLQRAGGKSKWLMDKNSVHGSSARIDAVQVLHTVRYHAHFAGYSASGCYLVRTQSSDSGFFWWSAPGMLLV